MVRFLINKTQIMEFEEIIKQKLSLRGFTPRTLLNHRGLIAAVIDETILLNNKNLTIPIVNRSVWLVTNKHSGITQIVFDTREKAEACVNGVEHFIINEVLVI